ncbi:MAG: ABC transporter ATP-binding protein [Deltaproteobacteria bacterium]|nr:ABC transporter ATP-binding protein [Deltaproteobacteria bacterium]MBW2417818.1 ABC transporter ATP-binding protein [Deltaproteobacteria bacterium]
MSGLAVEARGLEKRFGAVVALRGVDLALPRGSALAVLGPNGAGKSTLLKILAGLTAPSHGTVRMYGRDGHSGSPRKARAWVGYVGHATLLYPELTARENLIFAARLYGVKDPGDRADHLLEEEGLTEFSSRRAGAYSRGMSQRLAIARALVHDPELVLLDEPFTGLDHRSTGRLGERLRGLRDEGRSLVLITHDLRQASELADAALFMARGRVVHRSGQAGELTAAALESTYVEIADRPGPGPRGDAT